MAEAEIKTESRRRMTIHLGVQKTGTTSIQRFLHQNHKVLASRLTLRLPLEGTPMRPLGRAAVAYSLNPQQATKTALLAAISEVRDGLPDTDVPVLISHENLSGAMPGNGGETDLYPALPDIIALLDQGFAGFDLNYVVYSRRMGQWKPSVWAQAVRTDGYLRNWTEFEAETADLPGWSHLIRRLEKAAGAGRITHLRLEDEIDPGHPGSLLLRHLGFSETEIAELAPLQAPGMERLPDGATEFFRRLNGLEINPNARRKVIELAARMPQLFATDTPPKASNAPGRS